MNRLSQIFRPLKLPPKNTPKATESMKTYKMMLNLGIINRVGHGFYHLLPLGERSLNKLVCLIENSMRDIGAQKVTLPILTREKLWESCGTLDATKNELYCLTDRNENRLILSPTYEEAFTSLLSSVALSHRSFPLLLYQISQKFRDEMCPRNGLIRSNEFLMKDLYSFDSSEKEALNTFQRVNECYDNIFEAIGVPFLKVPCLPEPPRIKVSQEFHYVCDIGDDKLSSCSACGAFSLLKDAKPACRNCGALLGKEDVKSSVEVGHTFYFGTHYSDALKAQFVDDKGERRSLFMASYGIGVTRLLAAAVETLSKPDQLRWPSAIAPFTVCLIPPKEGSHESIQAEPLMNDLYQELSHLLKDDIVIDDRYKETIGRRLLEAKMIGFPFIVIMGKESLKAKMFEFHDLERDTVEMLSSTALLDYVRDRTNCSENGGGGDFGCRQISA